MTNDPNWDSIFGGQEHEQAQPQSRRERREMETGLVQAPRRSTFAEVSGGGRPPRRRRRLGWLWALIVVLVLGGIAAGSVWFLFEDKVREVLGWQAADDYTGSGNGTKATVTIASGDVGLDVAKSLAAAHVTMTTKAAYDILLTTNQSFEPGTYQLEEHMSAAAALKALADPANRVQSRIVIPEGSTLTQIVSITAKATGLTTDELDAVLKDYTSLGIPKSAPNAEGWLFPATYEVDPGETAQQVLQRMQTRMVQSLDKAGVAEADREKVLTLASIVQKEGGSTDDFGKVSRVFTNRLDDGMLLQSDATVSYGAHSASLFTTGAQRSDAKNLYNTYVHQGLPVGPISSPGDDAIDAALHPVKGPWLYFVLVNGETGETAFSTTEAEHEAAVAKWHAWLAAHPDYNTGG